MSITSDQLYNHRWLLKRKGKEIEKAALVYCRTLVQPTLVAAQKKKVKE
jgi:hypothetical protein